ncbi:MAG: hypothetical protein ABIP29_05260, partial [Candidatus Eisenbacteria bacterium]
MAEKSLGVTELVVRAPTDRDLEAKELDPLCRMNLRRGRELGSPRPFNCDLLRSKWRGVDLDLLRSKSRSTPLHLL